ncbi:MAG: alkaline phosphatase family protein [Planctomycetes bacterium]|nr:alkaline phosphatase family protein [Planctomycetota bacterium]
MTEPDRRKLLMIGVDAGDLVFIREHEDRLPTLRALLAEGTLTTLGTPAESLTSAVWPSFATGGSPGFHGIYYPMQWDPEQMTLRRVTDDWLGYEPFWYELARQGYGVTVLDAPFCPRSRLERGTEVLNWGSQECLGPFHSNRPELATEIRRRFGRHPMGDDVPLRQSAKGLEAVRRQLVTGAQRKAELACWLRDTTSWNLFVTVFAESHRGGHVLWPDFGGRPTDVPPGALLDVYAAIDAGIGKLLDGIDRETTTVVVFSVHGMRTNYTQEHFVVPVMERLHRVYHGEAAAPAGEAEPKGGGGGFNPMRMLRNAVPEKLQLMLAKALPASVRDFVVRRSLIGNLDWTRTLGFPLIASGEGYLRFSVTGREASGPFAADSEQHARYRELLERSLLGLADAGSGRTVVRELFRAVERYPGPRAHLLPDVVVLWDDVLPSERLRSAELGAFAGSLNNGRYGEHRPEGFAIVAGDRRGLDAAPALGHVQDLREWAFHRLGAKVAAGAV